MDVIVPSVDGAMDGAIIGLLVGCTDGWYDGNVDILGSNDEWIVGNNDGTVVIEGEMDGRCVYVG